MSIIVFIEVAFIATIAALTWISLHENGFAINDYSPITSLADLRPTHIWESQYRWTVVPGFIMSVFAHCYLTMVSATAERQPYVELHNKEDKAKSAKLTILLDYPAKAIFYSWATAWHNGHVLLGFAMFVQLISSLIIVPFASDLLRPRVSQQDVAIKLESPTAFNISDLKLSTDAQPAIGVAGAVYAYGGSPPAWTTTDIAIERFSQTQQSLPGNISAYTNVYFAKLDCNIMPRSNMSINYTGSNVEGLGNVLINFTDRGCTIMNQGFPVSYLTPLYALTWFQACFGTNAWEDRIGVFMATYSDTDADNLSDLIAVSCIPSYHNGTAHVSMQFASDGTAQQAISVDMMSTVDMNYSNWRTINSHLNLYQFFDVSGDIKADTFGQTVYSYAAKLSGGSTLRPEAVSNATQAVYQTMFAALTETQLMATRPTAQSLNGTRLVTTTRLYIVVPVAGALISLLALMLICSVLLFFQAYTKSSVLKEDPVGLLGRAGVLFQSDVLPFIEKFRQEHGPEVKLVEQVEKEYSLKQSRCWYEGGSGDDIGRIRMKYLSWMSVPKASFIGRARLMIWKIQHRLKMWTPFSKSKKAWQRRKADSVGKDVEMRALTG